MIQSILPIIVVDVPFVHYVVKWSTAMFEDKVELLVNLESTYRQVLSQCLPQAASPIAELKRQHFMAVGLGAFLSSCAELFPYITDEDLATLGSEFPSTRMEELYALMHLLRDNGFDAPEDIPQDIVFWSGSVAKEAVKRRPDLCGDMDIPLFCALFSISTACLRSLGRYDVFNLHLGRIISQLFASEVTGIAHVYISSDKVSELPGLESANNFWHAELAQLQLGRSQGRISDIYIHRYNHQTSEWLKPLKLSSEEDKKKLLIRRREFHPILDEEGTRGCFKSQDKTAQKKVEWAASEPRPSISYERLCFFAQKLKETARSRTRGPSKF